MNTETNMTSCDDYQQKVSADPNYEGDGAHLSACHTCQAFRAEMQELDTQIARALKLSVPPLVIPPLPEIDSANVAQLTRKRLSTPAWLAVAATVMIAVLLGFGMLGQQQNQSSLADQIVAHIEHESFSIKVSDKGVSDDRLARVVPASVSSLDHSAGLITYAQSCVINGHQIPHLVVQGVHGPVTILLMPFEKIDAAEEIHSGTVNGYIFPVGDGSVAIVGENESDLQKIGKEVRDSVRWTT